MKTPEEAAGDVEAYVTCHGGLVEGDPGCGLQPLTAAEYSAQLGMPHKTWRCPRCGNSADYNDTESERVQGVNDDKPQTPPRVDPAERARILDVFAAAIDAPLPDGYVEQVRAVFDAAAKDIEATVTTHLLRSALFCDDVEAAHPQLSASMIHRVAADLLLRAAVVCVHSAKKREGTTFDPARFALVVFAQSEHWLALASKDEHALFADYKPGTLRAELEAEGLIRPLSSPAAAEQPKAVDTES